MAEMFHADVAAVIRSGHFEVFNFVDLEVDTPIYLTDYHADETVRGNGYVSSILKEVSPPPKTVSMNHDIQSFSVVESLNAFTGLDFLTSLGNYHGATAIVTSYVVGMSGALLTGTGQELMRTEGLILDAYRPKGAETVVVEVSTSYGKLDLTKELRTTRGSMARRSTSDTSFNRADAVNQNISLEWGS